LAKRIRHNAGVTVALILLQGTTFYQTRLMYRKWSIKSN